ncbi:MAG: squalene/phytoene synthase family protein, partial [Acidimicrobiales bacterium]
MTISLEESYARCKSLNRRFGKTYYYATQVLEPDRRKYVHALYGFCRYVDDIVDEFGPVPIDERIARVDAFEQQFFADVARGDSEDAVLR